MRALLIDRWCEPEALRVVDVPTPVCDARSVRIRVRTVPITHSLWLLIQGQYQRKPQLPFVPGSFAAGEVLECGVQAQRFRPGDRVIAALECGGLAEQVVAPEVNVYAIPASLSFERANALNCAYSAALAALTWRHVLNLTAGERLLVLGAAGGVGTAAVEIARILDATVIAAASTQAKREWARAHGAHHAIDAAPERLRDEVMAVTAGEGVHAVLDPVGGDGFREGLRCLVPEGRLATLGYASGAIPQLSANRLLVKNVAVCGLNMGYYKLTQAQRYESRVRALFATLGQWFEEGRINPATGATFALENTAQAFRALLDRNRLGPVVVVLD